MICIIISSSIVVVVVVVTILIHFPVTNLYISLTIFIQEQTGDQIWNFETQTFPNGKIRKSFYYKIL